MTFDRGGAPGCAAAAVHPIYPAMYLLEYQGKRFF